MTTLNAPQDRARHDGPLESQLDHAFGQIHLSVGAYHEALRALRRVVDAGGGASAAADLVEAALRSGSVDEATETAARLAGWTAEHDRPLERGLLARVSALLAADQDAEVYYQRSIADLSAVPDRLEAARSQLLYGEWLRRQRRRVDARVALRAAFRTFDQRPSRAFADRARGELLATCALARPGSSETPTALTSREREVAQEVGRGRTNQEVAARLYLSPATVDFHLRKVFRKLGIRSRRELIGHPFTDT